MRDCPPETELVCFTTGDLTEPAAELLCRHLQNCSTCQARVDELSRDADSMIAALRAPIKAEQGRDSPHLARMIAGAARLRNESANRTSPAKSAPIPEGALGLDAFISCLKKSGLIPPQEIEQIADSLRPESAAEFARELVAQERLTPFQARSILRGRWKGFVLGNYVILERLGHGGMGSVYKARHKRMGRIVCLKTLHNAGRKSPEMMERFRREARAVAALDHPNFVVAHDADEENGIPFLVMEYIDGRDLARVIAEDGAMPAKQAVEITRQIADALEYAHRCGMVHRDIKPHNLLLSTGEASVSSTAETAVSGEAKTVPEHSIPAVPSCRSQVKILDMGIARFDSLLGSNADATTHASMTSAGVVMGTVDYMSPEQALNSRLADARSDIYSLGCTLYFLVTGRVPFTGETMMEKLVAHREQDRPTLQVSGKNVSAGLNVVFQRMVAKDPENRYASMAELASDLRDLQNGRPPRSIPGSHPWNKRLVAVTAGCSVLLILGTIGLVTWLGGDKESLDNSQAAKSQNPAAPGKFDTPKPVIKGHSKTLFNGGPGRVLVVIPHAYFFEDHYESIRDALRNRGAEMVTASSQPGYANPKHGKIPKVAIDMTLDQFDVNDFDAVIFLGGNYWEFTHKGGNVWGAAKRAINESLNAKRAVAAIDSASGILDDAGVRSELTFKKKNECYYASPKGKPGFVATLQYSGQSADLISLLFDDLLARR